MCTKNHSLKTKKLRSDDKKKVHQSVKKLSYKFRPNFEHFETIEKFIQEKCCKFLNSSAAISNYFFNKTQFKTDAPCVYSNLFKTRGSLGRKDGWFAKSQIHRNYLISWLEEVCSAFKFSAESMSLTVLLIDTLSTKYNENSFESHLLALLCLSIATKLNGSQNRQLGLHKISEYFDSKISVDELATKESQILSDLDFRAMKSTVCDFLTYYLSLGFISVKELETIKGPLMAEHKLEAVEIMLLNMNYEALKYSLFNFYEKSIVACSFIATVRKSLGLTVWTDELVGNTFHKLPELRDCMKEIVLINLETLRRGPNFCQQNVATKAYMRNSLIFGSCFPAETGAEIEDFDDISICEQIKLKTDFQSKINNNLISTRSILNSENPETDELIDNSEQNVFFKEEMPYQLLSCQSHYQKYNSSIQKIVQSGSVSPNEKKISHSCCFKEADSFSIKKKNRKSELRTSFIIKK